MKRGVGSEAPEEAKTETTDGFMGGKSVHFRLVFITVPGHQISWVSE